MLAGIPKTPSRFNPITNFARAEIRQHYVLNRMKALGYLTPEQTEEAFKQRVVVRGTEGASPRGFAIHGDYPAELARQLMYGVFQEQTYSKGIDVYTTIDSRRRKPPTARCATACWTTPAARSIPARGPDRPARRRREGRPGAGRHPGRRAGKDAGQRGPAGRRGAGRQSDGSDRARSARDIITISDKKALAVVARALNPKASDSQRLRRGSVVYIHKAGDGWEIINMPALQAALVSMAPQDGAIRAMIGGFDYNRGTFSRATGLAPAGLEHQALRLRGGAGARPNTGRRSRTSPSC